MHKCIGILLYPSYSHILPMLKLIQLLALKHKTVFCFCQDRKYQKLIESRGGNFVYIRTNIFSDCNAGFRTPLQQLNFYFDQCVQSLDIYEKEILSRDLFLLISDNMCVHGELISKKYGIPNICFHTDFIYTQSMREQMLLQSARKNRLAEKEVSRILRAFQLKSKDGYDVLDTFYSKKRNIVFLPRLFQDCAEMLPDPQYRFVGYHDNAFHACRRKIEKKGVLIDWGDASDAILIHLYRETIRQVRELGLKVCLNTTSPAVYQWILNHIRGMPFIEAMHTYCMDIINQYKYYVTSGGMSYVREAILYKTVPIIFPQHFDHQMTARQVLKFQAGIKANSVKDCFDIYQKIQKCPHDYQCLIENLTHLKRSFCLVNTYPAIIEEVAGYDYEGLEEKKC